MLSFCSKFARITMHKAFLTFNRFVFPVLFLLCICWAVLFSGVAQAQDCTPPFEMVTHLSPPVPGAPVLWNTTFGDQNSAEQFTHIVETGGGVLGVGLQNVFKDVRPHLLFTFFDMRGRDVSSQTQSVDKLISIADVHPYKGGFVVLAHQRLKTSERTGFWVGFFTLSGQLKNQKNFSDAESSLRPRAIVADVKNDGWIVSATSERSISGGGDGVVQQTARLYSLDKNGEERLQRSYFLGGNSEILNLSVSKNFEGRGRYIATGRFDNNYGLSNAWVLRLRPDLSLEWQQEFRRGKSAQLLYSVQDESGAILVAGDVDSRDSFSAKGVWFAMLGADNGDVILQRYFYSEDAGYSYSMRGLEVEESGRVTLLMAATLTDGERSENKSTVIEKNVGAPSVGVNGENYARILYLSPRGITIGGHVFAGAEQSNIHSFSRISNGSVAMAGYSLVEEKPDYSRPYQVEDDVEQPLREEGQINLPYAELTENTEKGLALLKKKIRAQDVVDGDVKESAKPDLERYGLTQDGWVVVAEPDPVYSDPCK